MAPVMPIVCLKFDGLLHDHVPDPLIDLDETYIAGLPTPHSFAQLLRIAAHCRLFCYDWRSRTPAGITAMIRWLQAHNGERLLGYIRFPRHLPLAHIYCGCELDLQPLLTGLAAPPGAISSATSVRSRGLTLLERLPAWGRPLLGIPDASDR
jgi:hypothetical protein